MLVPYAVTYNISMILIWMTVDILNSHKCCGLLYVNPLAPGTNIHNIDDDISRI